MYEELFQTTDRPFRATPDARYYFPFESMEQARQTVLRAVRRAEGPAVVMGNVGLGKSLLSMILAEDLQDRFDVVRLHAARLCSRRALLQSILFELQMAYKDLSEGELRLSLMERMEPSPIHAADGLVILVDEAHTLPVKLIEELRLITNFARQGQFRARLVLIGNLQLEETFSLPELSSFHQRIAARCYLQPMNRQQSTEFIRHQFNCVKIDIKQIMTKDAIESVYIASDGVPRLINQLMDHALILAIANGQTPISAALIQEAWADLQQLPVSWSGPATPQPSNIEFGSLDEEDTDFELEPEDEPELHLQSAYPVAGPNSGQQNTISSNFWPTPSDLEDFGPEPFNDQDMLVLDEDEDPASTMEPSRNMFSAWRSGNETIIEIEIPRAQFENAIASGIHSQPTAVQPPAENPFGEDFDEEFTIAADDIKRWQLNQQSRMAIEIESARDREATEPASASKAPAAIPFDHSPQIAPITHDASMNNNDPMTISSHTAAPFPQGNTTGYEAAYIAAAATSGSPEALQQEIEDIISQLNFSAFSLETTSVENISPDFNREPAPQAPIGSTHDDQYSNYRVYPLHTEEELDEINITLLDDDRDLLIIEEDIPASIRFSTPTAQAPNRESIVAPTIAPPSYPELFQQLRN